MTFGRICFYFKQIILCVFIIGGIIYVDPVHKGPVESNAGNNPESCTAKGKGRCPAFCDAGNCDSPECSLCEFSCGKRCNFDQERIANAPKLENLSNKVCLLPNFKNITQLKMPHSDPYWGHFPSSGRPSHPETAPLFVDIDEDGILDYFRASHQEPIELAITYAPNRADKSFASPNSQALRLVSQRIIPNRKLGDKHGQNIVDLDGDGLLDLLVSGGGGLGGVRNDGSSNLLFYGEQGRDAATGNETTIFRGGRAEAKAAGIALTKLRGRFNFILDFNGDGLLDIFFAADRLKIDKLAPGSLMLNQGDRSWKAVADISEYSKAVMVSDVDGDGFANELIVTRDFCYPQRKPPYSDEVVNFCKKRPVGTTAVFKYNKITGRVDNIGKHYSKATPDKSKQPPCCKPGKIGSFARNNRNCYVRSLASGDFDGDLLADQVFLYCSKLLFYFSSDRIPGQLPFGKRIVGSEVHLPADCAAAALRLFDMDNNGTEEILVSCFQPGRHVVITRGETFRDWSIDNGCNGTGGLGDLKSTDSAVITQQEMEEMVEGCKAKDARFSRSICRRINRGHTLDLKTAGVTIADLNNDGFLDLVVAYKSGKMQFFENQGARSPTSNRFIAFTLSDRAKTTGSALAVGATLILNAKNCKGCETQFREVSSYQTSSDKYGYKDERIIFGLGAAGTPTRLLVRWPDGTTQTVDLRGWKYTRHMQPISIVKTTG